MAYRIFLKASPLLLVHGQAIENSLKDAKSVFKKTSPTYAEFLFFEKIINAKNSLSNAPECFKNICNILEEENILDKNDLSKLTERTSATINKIFESNKQKNIPFEWERKQLFDQSVRMKSSYLESLTNGGIILVNSDVDLEIEKGINAISQQVKNNYDANEKILQKQNYEKSIPFVDPFLSLPKEYNSSPIENRSIPSLEAVSSEQNSKYTQLVSKLIEKINQDSHVIQNYIDLGCLMNPDQNVYLINYGLISKFDLFKKAILINPYFYTYFKVAFLLKDFEKITLNETLIMKKEDLYVQCINLNPSHAYAYNNLANLLPQEGKKKFG